MNWQIQKKKDSCNFCGRELQNGEELFSSLRIEANTLERVDSCVACWQRAVVGEDVIYWKTHYAQNPQRQRRIDYAALRELFFQLCEKPQVEKAALHYLIGLLLVRKRLLKIRQVERTAQGEYLLCAVPRGKETYRVPIPALESAKLEQLREELRALIEGPEELSNENSQESSQATDI